MQFCREAAIAACDRDLRPEETPLLTAMQALLANLQGELVTLRSDLTGVLTDASLRTLATLEEVLSVRVILTNAAELISRGEQFANGDMDELEGVADKAKARKALKLVAALSGRLQQAASAASDPAPKEAANA
jgi:hypothetical protein